MIHVRQLLWIVAFSVALCIAADSVAARQPAPGPMRALQKLAEKQGHPEAAVRDLEDLGFQVPPDVEAAAAGITPKALQKAMEQDGSLAARLETALGKPLSPARTRQIQDAESQYAESLKPLQEKYAQDVSQITGLPQGKLRKILITKQGAPTGTKKALAEIEKSLGRRLSAGDAGRFTDAQDEFLAACQSERKVLARQVAKIAAVPLSVVWALVR